MAVLVTGGAGYIGSHMVLGLLERGEEVVVVDRLSTGFEWAVPEDAHLVIADVGDARMVASTMERFAVDSIIHFAGSIVVPESVSDPLAYYRNNTANSMMLIEAAVRHGVKHFIFSSTAAVYGTPSTSIVAEDAPLAPVSPYGCSKMMTELMLRDASLAHGFAYAALRYFNVAGADPGLRTGQSSAGSTHLLKIACEAATGKRDFVEIYGTDYATRDGTCIRDYVHVSDLIQAHYLALDHLRCGGSNLVANCGYGHGYSVREVLAAVERVTGVALDIREARRRPGDAAAVVANASLIRKVLNWSPRHDDIDTIVSHALAWEMELKRRGSRVGRSGSLRYGSTPATHALRNSARASAPPPPPPGSS